MSGRCRLSASALHATDDGYWGLDDIWHDLAPHMTLCDVLKLALENWDLEGFEQHAYFRTFDVAYTGVHFVLVFTADPYEAGYVPPEQGRFWPRE